MYSLTETEAKGYLQEQGVVDILETGVQSEIPPKWDDLARLYYLVRNRKPFQILEFGSGFSTLVMASALKQNWLAYKSCLKEKNEPIANDQPFLISVESSTKWRENTESKIDKVGLTEFVDVVYSEVTIAEYNGQICHFYDEVPDVVPDFVYLDGPDPMIVKGSIRGLSFQNPKRTVMAADLLLYESTLTPGFFMIVDGRSNNARFLQRMLKRKYDIYYHEKADVTTFELLENRLGRKNVFGWEAYAD